MARFISLVLAVAGIWVAAEVYTHGVNGAFGGSLARFGGEESEEAVTPGTAPQRAGPKRGLAFRASPTASKCSIPACATQW